MKYVSILALLVIFVAGSSAVGTHSGMGDAVGMRDSGRSAAVEELTGTPAKAPYLRVYPYWLTFHAWTDSLSLSIRDAGSGGLEWSITGDQTWLIPDPASGDGAATVWVRVDRTGLADGTYNGELTVTSNGGVAKRPVEMTVASGPVLWLSSTSLVFSPAVTDLPFSITNVGIGTLTWSLSADQPWIQIIPPLSGSGDAGVTVQVDPATVPPGGTQTGHITVDTNGGTTTIDIQFDPATPYFPGVIGLYADVGGTNCNILYGGPGLRTVYVVHTQTDGATAVQFSAPMPRCWTNAVYLSDVAIWPVTIGNSQDGVALGYGMCLDHASLHIYGINYFVHSPPIDHCCMYPVLPDPRIQSGEIEIVDCGGNVHFGTGGFAIINPTSNCMCGEGTVTVHEATWGRIKSLYR